MKKLNLEKEIKKLKEVDEVIQLMTVDLKRGGVPTIVGYLSPQKLLGSEKIQELLELSESLVITRSWDAWEEMEYPTVVFRF